MDFRQLEVCLVLSQELHFAKAAKRCHMTASALTRSIQRLESELGVDLFVRNNRRVEITSAGKVFLGFAEETVKQWGLVREQLVSESADIAGELTIFSSVTASYSILSVLLANFRRIHPSLEIKLHTGDQAESIERVESGREEIVIAALPDELPSSLVFKTLAFSRLRFIMPAAPGVISEQIDQLGSVSTDVKYLAQLPMIVSEQGLTRQRLNAWLKKHAVSPNIYAQVSGHEAIVSMVALGFGIGLVPELVINHSPQKDKIRIIDDAPELQAFQIGICAQKSQLELRAAKAFWDAADPALF